MARKKNNTSVSAASSSSVSNSSNVSDVDASNASKISNASNLSRTSSAQKNSNQRQPLLNAALKRLKPYGYVAGDGVVKISLLFPITPSIEAYRAAQNYVEKMGFTQVRVLSAESTGPFTIFVVEGQSKLSIDFTRIKVLRPEFETQTLESLQKIANEKWGRALQVRHFAIRPSESRRQVLSLLDEASMTAEPHAGSIPFFKIESLETTFEKNLLIDWVPDKNLDILWFSIEIAETETPLKWLKTLQKILKEKPLPESVVKVVEGPGMTHDLVLKTGFHIGFEPGWLFSEAVNVVFSECVRIGKN